MADKDSNSYTVSANAEQQEQQSSNVIPFSKANRVKEAAAGYSLPPVAADNPTSLQNLNIHHKTVGEDGLHLTAEELKKYGIKPGKKISIFMHNGDVAITANPHKQTLLHSAEELQQAQDETKVDHSQSISALVGVACSVSPLRKKLEE